LDECEIQIYDSWGNKIFERTGYENEWDGTRAGDPLPAGVYYYVISCVDDNPLTGSITLIR
jgi:gliding motility-associated-like protein